jgi:hypothetical protein
MTHYTQVNPRKSVAYFLLENIGNRTMKPVEIVLRGGRTMMEG